MLPVRGHAETIAWLVAWVAKDACMKMKINLYENTHYIIQLLLLLNVSSCYFFFLVILSETSSRRSEVASPNGALPNLI